MRSILRSIVLSAAATAATYAVMAWLDAADDTRTEQGEKHLPEIEADDLTADEQESLLSELEAQL